MEVPASTEAHFRKSFGGEDKTESKTPAPGERPVLKFLATQAQPQFAKLFLSTGGAINAAAAAGATDFAMTGSTVSVSHELHHGEAVEVTIELPADMYKEVGNKKIQMTNSVKMLAQSQRAGTAINGVIVDTYSGSGAVYLAALLRKEHYQLPIVYGVMASHAAVVGMSNIRILNKEGNSIQVEFVEDPLAMIKKKAEGITDTWAHTAWALRENIIYTMSPTLTKTVGKVPVGVNDKGYSLVHDILDQPFSFGSEALNSLLEHAVGMELEYSDEQIRSFLGATTRPGLSAAVWMPTVAAACSTMANYLLAYRADGRAVMGPQGATHVPTESWLRAPKRSACSSDDCDGSAMMTDSVLQATLDATEEDLQKYPYLRAVKNTVHPYFTFGVSVVGATSAEASGGGTDAHEHVAGHAIAVAIPTLNFLEALHRAAPHTVGKEPVTENSAAADALHAARFGAIFTPEVLDQLPEHERTKLQETGSGLLYDTRSEMGTNLHRLQAVAMEGTTPASPVLYETNADRRAQAARDAHLDRDAFAQIGPHCGRSYKVLHVGGRNGEHRFYRDLLEVSLHAKHPLYTDPNLRSLCKASSQYVLVNNTGTDITSAGVSPKNLVEDKFMAVPLFSINTDMGEALDVAAAEAKKDVMPPRAEPMVLSALQSANVQQSIAVLKTLDKTLLKEETQGHCVAYLLSFSALANNPAAVKQFADSVSACATTGVVDTLTVKGLAKHPGSGEDAAPFVIVNAVIRV